jgi:hypothetical protein
MWPRRSKRSNSCLGDPFTVRVFDRGGVGATLLDVHHDRPSTVWRVLEVLVYWVVVLFPSVQCSIALKACGVVRIRLIWFVVEASVCQLQSEFSLDHTGSRILHRYGHTSAGDGLW